ncbi:hypothetical protein MNBD_GAMMA10-1182 [hydrothermal vent metagenome]|uniref:Uncharacterized protein n=1 Tax=hydrothermal vent metagenome TaxID=652676 RepID=A0A3B0XXK6_9ZZZZ
MNTLIVEKVALYTPGDESASVTLRSTHGSIVVFCYPCNLETGDIITNHLSALDANVQTAYLSDWPEEEKKEKTKEWLKRTGAYSYRGCGRVINQAQGLIEVLGFQIEIEDIPCDGAVEFKITRIDI